MDVDDQPAETTSSGGDADAPYGRCAHCGDPLPPRLPGVGGRPLKYCPETPTKKCRSSHNNAARARTDRDSAQLRRDHQSLVQSAELLAIAEQLADYRRTADQAYTELLARNQDLEEQVAELTADNAAVRVRADAALREAQRQLDQAREQAEQADRAIAAAEAKAARAVRARGVADGHRQAAERAARRQARVFARERQAHERSLAAAQAALTATRSRTSALGRDLHAAHQRIQHLQAALAEQRAQTERERTAAAERQRAHDGAVERLTALLDEIRLRLAATEAQRDEARRQAAAATARAERAEQRQIAARRPLPAPVSRPAGARSAIRARADGRSGRPGASARWRPDGLGTMNTR